MRIERYKSMESELNGAVLTTLIGKVVFESDDWSFEDPNMRGNEEFVKVVLSNEFDNGAEPMSTITINRANGVYNTYRLLFDMDNIKVSDADMLADTALMAVMPFASAWYKDLVREAIEVATSLSLSESVSESESISLSESESVWLSESLSQSESVSTSESVSLSLYESESESVYLSESESVRASESIYVAVSEYEAGLFSELDSEFDVKSESISLEYASMSESVSEQVASLESSLSEVHFGMVDVLQRDDRDARLQVGLSVSDYYDSLVRAYMGGVPSPVVDEDSADEGVTQDDIAHAFDAVESESPESWVSGDATSEESAVSGSYEDVMESTASLDASEMVVSESVSVSVEDYLPSEDNLTSESVLKSESEVALTQSEIDEKTQDIVYATVVDGSYNDNYDPNSITSVSINSEDLVQTSVSPEFEKRTESVYNSLSESIHDRIHSESVVAHSESGHIDFNSMSDEDLSWGSESYYQEMESESEVEKRSKGIFGWLKRGNKEANHKDEDGQSFRSGSLSSSDAPLSRAKASKETVYSVNQDQIVSKEDLVDGEPVVKTHVRIRKSEPLVGVKSAEKETKRKQFKLGDDESVRVEFDAKG